MTDREARLRCLEQAGNYADDMHEAMALADIFLAYIEGRVESISVNEDQADALNEREEGQHNEH